MVLRGSTPSAVAVSLKSYLQKLLGPSVIQSQLYWLSVLLPPSFTVLSQQVPALIAAPTLQVSLFSHLLHTSHTCSLSSSLPHSWTHSPVAILTDITSVQACCLWHSKDAAMAFPWLWTFHNTFMMQKQRTHGVLDSWAERTVAFVGH